MKTYSVTTYGCQMNHSDSERVASVCESMGYVEAKEGEIADLYIFNTCSIRQKAEDKVLGMGKKFSKIKAKKSDVKTILTGCMAKRDIRQGKSQSLVYQEKYTGKLKKQMPWLDYVLEINDIHKLPSLLDERVDDKPEDYFAVQPKYNSKFQAFVPISTGCNKFCTFCIVPFTRGEEVYRPYDDIYSEVESLIKQGYKEITLLGQNVNSWKSEITNNTKIPVPKFRKNEEKDYLDFADLMENLADIPGEFWLRFTSSHPYDIHPRLIEICSQKENIAKQFHFALQSGSDTVLKRMNRHYSAKDFKEKVKNIYQNIPDVGITTDVIVGFCNESDKEFNQTIELCNELKFDQIFISEYSQREGTIASKFYKDDVDREIKGKRKEALDKILRKGLNENNKKLIGTTQKVLVYKENKKGVFARTTQAKDLLIANAKEDQKIGEFVKVKITGASGFHLTGEMFQNS